MIRGSWFVVERPRISWTGLLGAEISGLNREPSSKHDCSRTTNHESRAPVFPSFPQLFFPFLVLRIPKACSNAPGIALGLVDCSENADFSRSFGAESVPAGNFEGFVQLK